MFRLPVCTTRYLQEIVNPARNFNITPSQLLDARTVWGDASTDGSVQRPDIVANVPFYLYPSGAVGGKVTIAPAFTTPVPATVQGDLGRNAQRGCDGTMKPERFRQKNYTMALATPWHRSAGE
jgi:hypothetical protein